MIFASLVAASIGSFSATPAFGEVSKSGIPYLPDNEPTGPGELVTAIRVRRGGPVLLGGSSETLLGQLQWGTSMATGCKTWRWVRARWRSV